jgi:protein tyrosine phosphatase (PTP) superfamily phosphohydrolase (DUF442 family)
MMSEPQLTQIYNFLLIDERLATAGQPTAQQLAAIQTAGYEVIINLGMPDSPHFLLDEDKRAAALGLDYIPIPVEWTAPTGENLAEFFQAMDANQDRKRFVHCLANMRVSAFTFLYRVIRQGVPVEEAQQTLYQIWQPNPIWQEFIEEELAKRNIELP